MADNNDAIMRLAWPTLAALAGAVTALSFRPYKKMSAVEIIVSLTVGTSFSVFVGPWVAVWVFGNGPVDIRLLGGLFYLMASGSNILIPIAVRKLAQMLGTTIEGDS
jgi:membrane protein CcdC involved in cytochrome C biogenesis